MVKKHPKKTPMTHAATFTWKGASNMGAMNTTRKVTVELEITEHATGARLSGETLTKALNGYLRKLLEPDLRPEDVYAVTKAEVTAIGGASPATEPVSVQSGHES